MGGELNVECYSGASYPERPVALRWQGERLEVQEILLEWRSPTGKGWRVKAGGEQLFELFYDEEKDEWQVTALA